MTEVSSHLNSKILQSSIELNNNSPNPANNLVLENYNSVQRSGRISVSSASSSNSDSSEDAEVANLGVDAKEPKGGTNNQIAKKFDIHKTRSMSDGQAGKLMRPELIEVFPSLPDSVLEKLGLSGDESKDRLNEEELEQKFVALALAFTIDAATIKDRCERQRRYRDQTETNLNAEIDRLIEKVAFIQPLCVDAETADLLTGLLAQIDVIIRASSHAATSAERFGAVQHELRLSEAVNLMINHVTLLKQQRDSTRKQLQYTKRVLQDTNSSESSNVKSRSNSVANGKILTKRRASIATISQPSENKNGYVNVDPRRITRRTSDLSSRVSAFARSSRPSRLELGVDLDKIKEGIVDDNVFTDTESPTEEKNEESSTSDLECKTTTEDDNTNYSALTFGGRMSTRCQTLYKNVQESYENYAQNGRTHELFYFAALLCFALGLIVLGNILVEFEYGEAYPSIYKEDLIKNKLNRQIT